MVSSMSRKRGMAAIVRFFCLLAIAAALVSCGGGGGGGSAQQTPPSCPPCAGGQTSFWATDFTSNSMYCLCAQEIAVGTHSRIFAEDALLPVTPADVAWVINAFDNQIYPSNTTNFGSEPNPGIDGDSKVTILLLNIRDGYNGTTVTSFTAGYFDPGNEYSLAANPYSNRREMFYMNANPNLPLTQEAFNNTLTHEFQHMIHWQQKVNLKGLEEDIWLNEAMSEVAPTYIYGPSYARVLDYEQAPTDSLITWDGQVSDYGIVYMWAQYYKDRFGGSIFKSIMDTNSVGITSVNSALTASFPGATFDSTFSDLSFAILLGTISVGNPNWSYTSIDTAPGTYSSASGTVTLPGILISDPTPTGNLNPSTLPSLGAYSIGFSWYSPSLPPDGSVTWTAASTAQKAHFIDDGNGIFTTDITSGATYTYITNGFLIVRNPSTGTQTSGGSVVSFAPKVMGTSMFRSPSQMLAAANRKAQAEGRPRTICVHSAFTEKEREMRQKGHRPGF